jgi:hypothetical protein
LTFIDADAERTFSVSPRSQWKFTLRAWVLRDPFDINTSLSRTLFFLTYWCKRKKVHFDSRVHFSD